MNNADNILSYLKDFSIQPPGELYQRITQSIFAEEEHTDEQLNKTLSQLQDYQITPSQSEQLFQNIYSRIVLTPIEEKAAELKHREVEPPTGFFQKIWLRINSKKQKAVLVPMAKRVIRVAAAILLILVATWSIITFKNDDPTKDKMAASNTANTPLALPHDSSSFTKTDSINSLKTNTTKLAQNSKKDKRSNLKNGKGSFTLMQIEDEYIKIRDNDILASFVNFTEQNIPSFVFDESKNENVKLRVDNSTSISISEGMLKMMRKMYGTKRNGKPTRKSKRMKKRIEKWQKADKAYFDIKPGKNPFDPIDLGNLIF